MTGTTVWELGAIYQGPWAQRFWSSAGCLFHHAYPIGYRASKQMFRDTYEMHIAAAEAQPLFQVSLPMRSSLLMSRMVLWLPAFMSSLCTVFFSSPYTGQLRQDNTI